MAKQNKPKNTPESLATLKTKLAKAISDGKTQQALDLAKQIHKAEPTSANLDQLGETYVARAMQLRQTGYPRDAVTVLEVAISLFPKNPAWLKRLIREITVSGDSQRAFLLVRQVPEWDPIELYAVMADNAIVLETPTERVAPELREDLVRIRTAFGQLELGKDEEVRTILQAIGLRSAFMEWKLLLRGFQAYYENEDAKAIDNWQRLDPTRPAARMAAPFRVKIDKSYQEAQPTEVQTQLFRQFDAIVINSRVTVLKQIRERIHRDQSLQRAVPLLTSLVQELREENSPLLPQFARALYWVILKETGPNDIQYYQSLFGRPVDDPNFNRMRGLALEMHDDYLGSHQAWLAYEQDVASNKMVWPSKNPQEVLHVRALLWMHAGDVARRFSAFSPENTFGPLQSLSEFFTPPQPSALQCFQKAIELAPSIISAHEQLLNVLITQKTEDNEAIIDACRVLLNHQPDHVGALRELAHRLSESGPEDALGLLLRAIKANPLELELRHELGLAHLAWGRHLSALKKYEQARAEMEAASRLLEEHARVFLLSCQSALELKVGNNTQAEEKLKQLADVAQSEAVVAWSMMAEMTLQQLPSRTKTQFLHQFDKVVSSQPTVAEALALTRYAWLMQCEGLTYYGLKTHFKKAVTFISKAPTSNAKELDLVELLDLLFKLSVGYRILSQLVQQAVQRFPKNPFIVYLQSKILRLGGSSFQAHVASYRYLQMAKELASAYTQTTRIRQLQEEIDEELQNMNAIMHFLQTRLPILDQLNPYSRGANPFDFDEDDDYEDDDEF